MAYENSQLAAAGVSGDAYLTKAKDGIMDMNHRRVTTDDVSNSATEWLRKNEESAVHLEGIDGNTHSLFYTKDERKAKKIVDILKERQLINQQHKRR